MLVLITILTSLTTIAAYAGEDGNKQKAEDDSAASIADCDENEVEQAGFDCIAIAANDVEIEESEETTTLSVCKERSDNSLGFEPADFGFTVTGNNPSPDEFVGDNSDGCVDVTIGPGEYAVTEVQIGGGGSLLTPDIEGECMQDPTNELRATGEIQAGETRECTFINTISD
jgi:hypothetical protein